MAGADKLEETPKVKKMKIPLLLLFVFAFLSLADAGLIASAGRDYKPTSEYGVYSTNPGDWHYEGKFASGEQTLSLLYRDPSTGAQFWTFSSGYGDGLVTNRTSLFKNEEGVTLTADAKPISGFYNTTINWTSNFTGKLDIYGWYQRSTITSAYHYNFSLWKNGVINFSNKVGITGGDTNYSYGAYAWDAVVGDNFSVVISAPNTSLADVYLNFTMFIQNSPSSPTDPNLVFNIAKANYSEGENVNQTVSFTNIPTNTNITSNFSVVYANGTTLWSIIYTNLTTDSTPSVSKNFTIGVVSSTSSFNETVLFNVTNNLSLSNGSFIIFNNQTTTRLHKIVLQNCQAIASTSPSAIVFTTFDETSLDYLNGSYYQLDLNASLLTGSFERNYSFIKNNTIPVSGFMPANVSICIYPEWQKYSVQGLVLYTNNTYVVRNYRVFANLTEVRQNVTLYSIKNSTFSPTTAEVDFTLKDYAGNLLSGYTIQIQRYFVGNGSYIGVAQAVTDYAGRAITFLDTNAQSFRVIVLDIDGNFVQSFSPVVLTASLLVATNTYGLTLTIQPQSYTIYPRYGHVSAGCTFTNSSGLLSCEVNDATQIGVSSTLIVQNLSINGWTTICTSSASGASVTLVCSVPYWNNTIFKYQLLLYDENGGYFPAGSGILDYRNSPFGSVSWGSSGWLIAIILMVAVFAMGFQNMNSALALLALVIIGIAWLNIITISLYAEISILLLIGIIMWKSRA